MAKTVQSDCPAVCNDKDAAGVLAQGHPKATGNVPTSWNQKDQNASGASLLRE